MAWIIGWSFNLNDPQENWCDKRVIKIEDHSKACEVYVEHHCRTTRVNNMAVLHSIPYEEPQ